MNYLRLHPLVVRPEPVGERRRGAHRDVDHAQGRVVGQVTVLSHLAPLSPLPVPLSVLLLDLVPLVRLAPGVVGRRTPVDEIVESAPGVLAGPEDGEVGLERLEQLVHHVTAGRGGGSAEGVVLVAVALVVTDRERLLEEVVVVGGESSRPDSRQDGGLVVLAVRAVGGVDQQ